MNDARVTFFVAHTVRRAEARNSRENCLVRILISMGGKGRQTAFVLVVVFFQQYYSLFHSLRPFFSTMFAPAHSCSDSFSPCGLFFKKFIPAPSCGLLFKNYSLERKKMQPAAGEVIKNLWLTKKGVFVLVLSPKISLKQPQTRGGEEKTSLE